MIAPVPKHSLPSPAEARESLVQRMRDGLGNPYSLLDLPLQIVAGAVIRGELPLNVVDRALRLAMHPSPRTNPAAYFVFAMQREFRKRGLEWSQKDGAA